jgi:hypothetical protein
MRACSLESTPATALLPGILRLDTAQQECSYHLRSEPAGTLVVVGLAFWLIYTGSAHGGTRREKLQALIHPPRSEAWIGISTEKTPTFLLFSHTKCGMLPVGNPMENRAPTR